MKINHNIKILETYRKVNRLMARSEDVNEICDGICTILVESREYFHAWIVLLENGSLVSTYYHKGFAAHQFQPMTDLLNKGIFPACIRKSLYSNSLSVVEDPKIECFDCPFKNLYDNLSGYNHPLIWSNELMGWISVGVPSDLGLDKDEQILFTELVEDISLALHNLLTLKTKTDLLFDFESERKFQLLFDNAPIAYQSLDEEGRFITVNRAWLETLGYEKNEVIGRWFGDFLHPDYVEAFRKLFPVFKKNGKIHSEFYMLHKSGNPRYITFEGKIGKTPEGNFRQTHCVLSDMTEKKLFETKLDESQIFLKHIFDNLPLGVVIYDVAEDNDFIIVDMNDTAQKISEVELEKIKGKKLSEVFPGAEEMGILKALDKVDKTGEPYSLPSRQYKDNRVSKWVENFISKLPNGQLIAIYNDITKEKTLENEIAQIRKMDSLGRLAGGIAHDINNLLTPVIAYSDALATRFNLEGKEKKYAETILQAGTRISELVSKLLIFSRKKEINPTIIDLNSVIQNFKKILGHTIHDNIELITHLEKDLPPIRIDAVQIEQILMNLCINAQDAMPDGGTIRILTEEKDNLILLEISDNGSGMSSQIIPHIFEPFYSTKGDNGTGLGLSTVYGIVTSQQGTIDVSSKPGEGTSFSIRFPVSAERSEETSKEPAIPSKITTLKSILVAEDNEDIRSLLQEGLSYYGYDVIAVDNGKKALAQLKEKNFDMVITDLIMPEMNGIELSEKATAVDKNLKFLFMSGYTNDYHINGESIRAYRDFIQKPFTLNSLLNKLQSTFENRQ